MVRKKSKIFKVTVQLFGSSRRSVLQRFAQAPFIKSSEPKIVRIQKRKRR